MPEIAHIYDGYNMKRYDLNYSVSEKRKASEIIIFSKNCVIPNEEELKQSKIAVNLR